jgi:hypothetical protein
MGRETDAAAGEVTRHDRQRYINTTIGDRSGEIAEAKFSRATRREV